MGCSLQNLEHMGGNMTQYKGEVLATSRRRNITLCDRRKRGIDGY